MAITSSPVSYTHLDVYKRQAISITTSTDTQGVYDKVKDFLTEYNNIINERTKLYNADSAGSYEPLTDDEKDQMLSLIHISTA